jgi:hypothetical protein
MKKQTNSKLLILLEPVGIVFVTIFLMAFACNNTDEPKPGDSGRPTTQSGAPTTAEVKEMIERKMTEKYETFYCCNEKNKVEFDWAAPIQLGGQETRGRIPVSCRAARIDVKITFTKLSTGETRSVRRGINGDPVKEEFCVYKDAYDEWTYLTYAP